eukprot:s3338_g4.t1
MARITRSISDVADKMIPLAGPVLLHCLLSGQQLNLFHRLAYTPGPVDQRRTKIDPKSRKPAEGALFLCMHAYLDVSFPQQSHLNGRAIRALCALHAADHVLKAQGEPRAGSAPGNRADAVIRDRGSSRLTAG